MPNCASDVPVSPLSLLICGTLAAFRQKLHLSTCPNLASQLYLPGPGTVFLGVEWRFVKAVLVGSKTGARVEFPFVRNNKPICELRTTVSNARGETCLSGTA